MPGGRAAPRKASGAQEGQGWSRKPRLREGGVPVKQSKGSVYLAVAL